jgi:hypothetical protein
MAKERSGSGIEDAPRSQNQRSFGAAAGMLQTMQQPAPSEPLPTPVGPTFAGMLAALAAPGQKRPPVRDLDGFEDDVATLSYERALRAHMRYRAPDPTDRALTQPLEAEPSPFDELSADEAAPAIAAAPAQAANSDAQFEAWSENAPGHDRHLRSASVTVRLSKAEYAQLRTRSAEAGLTVSAYLRSCTLEAESLRAQVKDTLAQLRSETHTEMKPGEIQVGSAPARGSWFGRLRFWPQSGEKLPATGS